MAKPKFPEVEVDLSGEDGNALAIGARVSRALRRAGHEDAAKTLRSQILAAGSYDEVLRIVMRTVSVS